MASTTKKMNVEEFRQWVKENDDNKLTHREMNEKEWKEKFTILCKKCGSQKVEFFGEAGVDYGGETGYSSGENGFKCLVCGNAITWWQ